jgi:hypothetical protein
MHLCNPKSHLDPPHPLILYLTIAPSRQKEPHSKTNQGCEKYIRKTTKEEDIEEKDGKNKNRVKEM